MIFKIEHTKSNINGKTWTTGPDEFVEAKSIQEVWEKTGSLTVHAYSIKGAFIPQTRTFSGGANEKFEGNSDFDWNRDKAKATAFQAGGFEGITVDFIDVRKL